ncbi:MAG: hypothetical protein ACLQMO_16385 [Acidobacteriaceae bacterium]
MPWTSNSKLPVPDDDATIWRYMDLPKFLSLIEQKALYFALSVQLEDAWEARVHGADYNALVEVLGAERADWLKAGTERVFRIAALNCWYCGKEESVAMWTLYTHTVYGVAIRSNVGRLKRALQVSPATVQLGLVQYRDLADSSTTPLDVQCVPPLIFLFQKRLCYQHESELRAYTLVAPTRTSAGKYQPPDSGVLVDVSLTDLIESVRLGPKFSPWAQKLIEAAFERAGINPPIEPSSAFAPPAGGPSLQEEK